MLKSYIERFNLKPSFDQTSIALMFLSIVFLYLLNETLHRDLQLLWKSSAPIIIARAGFFLFFGALFTFNGIFRNTRGSRSEHRTMVGSALAMNFFASLSVLIYVLKNTSEWYIAVFALFNLFVFVFTGLALMFHFYREDELFYYEKSKVSDILLGALFLGIFVSLCTYYFNMHWSGIFSMSVAYASAINRSVLKNRSFFKLFF